METLFLNDLKLSFAFLYCKVLLSYQSTYTLILMSGWQFNNLALVYSLVS